jgi:hypothetical protein
MRDYFKSLLPYRWVLLLLFNVLSLTLVAILILISNANFLTGTLYVTGNILFWFVVDYVLGIGQRNLWDRCKHEWVKLDDGLEPLYECSRCKLLMDGYERARDSYKKK